MPTAERSAKVTWRGDLADGAGDLSVESGAVEHLPVTWASRTQTPEGNTSPEELLAGAHATCYAMSLSHVLATEHELTAEELVVTANCTLEEAGEGFAITRMELNVRGRVPGMGADEFEDAAEAADAGCPVSNAFRGNMEIRVRAELQ